MGCGCDKRAKKILAVADRYEVKVPKKVRSFLERKAAGPTPTELVRQRAKRMRAAAQQKGGDKWLHP